MLIFNFLDVCDVLNGSGQKRFCKNCSANDDCPCKFDPAEYDCLKASAYEEICRAIEDINYFIDAADTELDD